MEKLEQDAQARARIRQLRKGINSNIKNIEEHAEKLSEYSDDPWGNDSMGILHANADNPDAVRSIIEGRINHLETELNTFASNIESAEAQIEILRAGLWFPDVH